MVLVSTEAFLAKLGEFYGAAAAKGSVVVSCKSVPASKTGGKAERARARAAPEEDRPVLLFRAAQYGNNKHKRKYSTVVTAAEHGAFHAALSQLLKAAAVDAAALADAASLAADARPGAPARVAKAKKASE